MFIVLFYVLVYKGVQDVPLDYERLSRVAKDKVKKTWNARDLEDVFNSTLGVCCRSVGHLSR